MEVSGKIRAITVLLLLLVITATIVASQIMVIQGNLSMAISINNATGLLFMFGTIMYLLYAIARMK